MKRIFFCLLIVLIGLNYSVSADVLVPIAKNVWIETKQDFPDFDFYVATIAVSSYYDKGRHYETHYDSLKLIPAKLTTKTPHQIPSDLYENDEGIYLVAVKKDAGLKNLDEIRSKVIAVAKGEKDSNVLLNRLNYSDNEGSSKKSERSKTYALESLSGTELKTSEHFGEPTATLTNEIAFLNGGNSNYYSIAIGLMITALIITVGLLFLRRR